MKNIGMVEVLLFIGYVMLCVGLWMIYIPSMLVIGGSLLLWAAWPRGGVKRGSDS